MSGATPGGAQRPRGPDLPLLTSRERLVLGVVWLILVCSPALALWVLVRRIVFIEAFYTLLLVFILIALTGPKARRVFGSVGSVGRVGSGLAVSPGAHGHLAPELVRLVDEAASIRAGRGCDPDLAEPSGSTRMRAA